MQIYCHWSLYNLKACREIKKYVCTLYNFNAMHNRHTAFVYAETRIKLIISEFLSARPDCDGRKAICAFVLR